ncbi:DUF6777 domain-containing protein [Streptomyces sp. NPDC005648]|uniref:DUF6777 domain-containing protein n=1 Tax=Streptomyces sp. NPDC005648 TaxID=3157044 RepID=UPI0033ACC512
MHRVTGTLVTACALSAALIVAGCGGNGDRATSSNSQSGEVFLQPAAARGPDPFTDSTATSPAGRSPATPSPAARATPVGASRAVRSVSGSTPGLYGGTERVGSCDVNRQIDYLTSDPSKARAFARAEGISEASVPDYLRGLAPVALRADTRVTNHGFRDGGLTTFQSVLQAGTAVLVDGRGVPRVRCACGNPLRPPVAAQGTHGVNGRPWSGYRPTEVIVVTPAPQVVTHITIVDVVGNTWIERPIGHDVHHDHVVPPPERPKPKPTPTYPTTPAPSPGDSESGTGPGSVGASPSAGSSAPASAPATHCARPTVTVTPGATTGAVATGKPSAPPTGCPTATVTATPGTTTPTGPTTTPGKPRAPGTPSADIGPPTVPDTPDQPDGGVPVPDGTTTGSIFDSPTDVLGG